MCDLAHLTVAHRSHPNPVLAACCSAGPERAVTYIYSSRAHTASSATTASMSVPNLALPAAVWWHELINLLERLPTPSAEPTSLLGSIQHIVHELERCPPCSVAEWEALVVQDKVPFRLCAALVKAWQHFEAPTQQWSEVPNQHIEVLLYCMSSALLQLFKASPDWAVCTASGQQPTTASVFRQQLEESGLLQHLPEVLTASTVVLTGYTAKVQDGEMDCSAMYANHRQRATAAARRSGRHSNGIAAAAAAGNAGSTTNSRTFTTSSTSSASAAAAATAGAQHALDHAAVFGLAHTHTKHLLLVCMCIDGLWPDSTSSLTQLPDGSDATVPHTLAALQHVSACLDHISSRGHIPSYDLLALTRLALTRFDSVCGLLAAGAGGVSQPTATKTQLMQVPGFMQCFLYSLMISYQAWMLRWEQEQEVGIAAAAAARAAAAGGVAAAAATGTAAGNIGSTAALTAEPQTLQQQQQQGATVLPLLHPAAAAAAVAAMSCSGSGSNTSWQEACRLNDEADDELLQVLARHLCEPQGFDSRVLLWAAVDLSTADAPALAPPANMLRVYQEYLSALTQRLLTEPGLPRQQEARDLDRGRGNAGTQQQQQQQEEEEEEDDESGNLASPLVPHLAAVAVLLHHLEAPPKPQHRAVWLQSCCLVMQCADSLAATYQELRLQECAGEQQMIRLSLDGKARLLPCLISDDWVGTVLEAVPPIITELARQLSDCSSLTGAAAGAASSSSSGGDSSSSSGGGGSSSSSGGGNRQDTAAVPAVAAAAVGDLDPQGVSGGPSHKSNVLTCVVETLRFVGCLGKYAVVLPADCSANQGAFAIIGHQVWLDNAAALLTAFELFVRAAPTADDPTSSSVTTQLADAIALVAHLCGMPGRRLSVLPACMLTQPHTSPVQQQLLQLQFSLLKAVTTLNTCKATMAATMCCLHAAEGVAPLLTKAASGGAACNRTSSASTAAAAATASAANRTRLQSLLLALMLLGRCCVGWGDLIQQLTNLPSMADGAGTMTAAAVVAEAAVKTETAEGCDTRVLPGVGSINGYLVGAAGSDVLQAVRMVAIGMGFSGAQELALYVCCGTKKAVQAFREFLQEGGDATCPKQLLSAAGYDAAGLQQQINNSAAALEHFGLSNPAEDMLQLLKPLGNAWTSLALPQVCNNPGCVNLSGPSELSLVNGSSCMCGGCRVAHYCCRQCQKSHWQQHKPVCKALVAAVAAAAAGANTRGPGASNRSCRA